jgi:hypothetical protein
MKVKIGDKIINVKDEPIMLIFDSIEEKLIHTKNITNMPHPALKYCIFDDETCTMDEAKNFMKID